MPGVRPSSRRGALGGARARPDVQDVLDPALSAGLVGSRGDAAAARAGLGVGWRMPAKGPLLRRAAGLVVGLAVLIPAATAVEGADHSPGHGVGPVRPPAIAAPPSSHHAVLHR